MCVCVCIYIYVYIYIYMCVCVCMYICIYIYIYIYKYYYYIIHYIMLLYHIVYGISSLSMRYIINYLSWYIICDMVCHICYILYYVV